jgi:hypothetical protein
MSSNRVKKFILNISQNATLNRENFIKKKKSYHILLANTRKNNKSYNNYIARRAFTSETDNIHYVKQPKMDPYNKFGLILLALGIYIMDGKFTSE